jgi:cytochrome c biogenesis protein CcdA/glutaredoxin
VRTVLFLTSLLTGLFFLFSSAIFVQSEASQALTCDIFLLRKDFRFIPTLAHGAFAEESSNKTPTLFIGEGCPHCAQTLKFLEDNGYLQRYGVAVKEIYFNQDNAAEFNKLLEEYSVPLMERGVPALLADGSFYTGTDKIEDYFRKLDAPQENDGNGGQSGSTLGGLLLPALIAGAVADSINPCAFAVLIILMTTVLASGKPRRALFSGLLFSLAVFLSYSAMGLGIYRALAFGQLPSIFMKIVGGLAIILGLLNLKDYFWYGGGGFVLEVPKSWRPRMKNLIMSVTSPLGAFLVGFAVSLFLLPCTSGPYVVVLGMLSQRTDQALAIAYLLLYNLIFVTPMVVITLIVYRGFDLTKAERIRQGKLRLLHLIAGLVLMGMGGAVLLGLV